MSSIKCFSCVLRVELILAIKFSVGLTNVVFERGSPNNAAGPKTYQTQTFSDGIPPSESLVG